MACGGSVDCPTFLCSGYVYFFCLMARDIGCANWIYLILAAEKGHTPLPRIRLCCFFNVCWLCWFPADSIQLVQSRLHTPQKVLCMDMYGPKDILGGCAIYSETIPDISSSCFGCLEVQETSRRTGPSCGSEIGCTIPSVAATSYWTQEVWTLAHNIWDWNIL